MENTKNCNGRYCYNCGRFRRHYTLGYMKFIKEDTGNCTSQNGVTGYRDTCEDWYSNQYHSRRLSELSIKTLNETIAKLVEITSVIKEHLETKQLRGLARERMEKRLNDIENKIDNDKF